MPLPKLIPRSDYYFLGGARGGSILPLYSLANLPPAAAEMWRSGGVNILGVYAAVLSAGGGSSGPPCPRRRREQATHVVNEAFVEKTVDEEVDCRLEDDRHRVETVVVVVERPAACVYIHGYHESARIRFN